MVELVTLNNGLKVVLAPCEAQSVAFGLFISSGSRHESDKTAGISHFIEHMLFKGTARRSQLEITQAIEGRGGNFNAWTSEESTAYFTHVPYEHLHEAVDIIADMFLHASIPAGEFEKEKQVIIEEIKMYADEPDAVAMENLQRSLFPDNRLGLPIAGDAASLLPMKPKDLKSYISSHYLPVNTIAVLVGRFERNEALKIVSKSLGGRFRNGKAGKEQPAITSFASPKPQIIVKKDVQQAQLALGYRTFGIADDRKYAATVFDAIMGRGMSSRLFQTVREKHGLSYDISSRMQFFRDAGMWTVTAGLDAGKTGKMLKTVDAELKRISSKKVTAAELNRTKEFLIGNFRMSHERVTSKLFYHGSTMLSFGRLIPAEEQVEGIRRVSAGDVLAVAKEILNPSRRSVSWVLPNGTGELPTP
jgi:predicted Zn-dependent peptidase